MHTKLMQLANEKKQFNDVMLEEGNFAADQNALASKHIHRIFAAIFEQEEAPMK